MNQERNKSENVSIEIRSGEIENSIRTLVAMVKKVDVFGNDENDEFRVIRESGRSQGIFKTWAVPAIPFVETGKEDSIESWFAEMKDHPLKLWQSLEKWRALTEVFDRRLATIYSERELPKNKNERVAEQYLRLITAFALAAPFYHLEAMVGDTHETKFNPVTINSTGEKSTGGGSLDLVAMALPSALRRLVITERLNWNDLNWQKITDLSKFDSDSQESVISFRIAKSLGVDIEDVVFAANVLQWIPVSVGGKIEDLSTSEAQKLIEGSLSSNNLDGNEAVGRNLNALIRFFNWFPLIKGERNFSGKAWRYAAACDTSDELLAEVNSGGVLTDEFEPIFKKFLSEQVKQLDATSAKGRFMIQLLNEGKVRQEVADQIRNSSDKFFKEIAIKLAGMEATEALVDIKKALPRAIVGGKSAGLREATIIFGHESIVPGVTLTTEAVENWLKSKPEIWEKIKELNSEKTIDIKLVTASKIAELIKSQKFPLELLQRLNPNVKLAVRSSSFDEDTEFNGTAAGIYESVTDVSFSELGNAIPEVVSSFFSEKAVSYRFLNGLRDIPSFAVVISPFIEGRGGAAFSAGNGKDWEIVTAESPAEVVGSKSDKFDSYKKSDGMLTTNISGNWVNKETIQTVEQMLIKAEKVLGNRVDLEFVVDQNNKVWVLQLRTIRSKPLAKETVKPRNLEVLKLNSLDDLDGIQPNNRKELKLVINPEIPIDQFQGNLFRWLTKNRNRVRQISLANRIPRTSHFANLCLNLGIDLVFETNEQ